MSSQQVVDPSHDNEVAAQSQSPAAAMAIADANKDDDIIIAAEVYACQFSSWYYTFRNMNTTSTTNIVADNINNNNPSRNKMVINHTSGKVYTDILVQCLLDYSEPSGQAAFDNETQLESTFVFDELGLLSYDGTDNSGNELSKLLTHVIFHPVQKSLNRQIQIDYTVRIQSLTNLITV